MTSAGVPDGSGSKQDVSDLPGGLAEKSKTSPSKVTIETVKRTLFGRVVKLGIRRSSLTEDIAHGIIEGLWQPRTLIAVVSLIGLVFMGSSIYFFLHKQPFLAPFVPLFLSLIPIVFLLVYLVIVLIDRRNRSGIVETQVKGSKTPVHIDIENTDIRETAEVVEGEMNISGIHTVANFLLNEPSKDGVQLANVRVQKTRLGNEVYYANYVSPHFIAGDISDVFCNQMLVLALGQNIFRIHPHYIRQLEEMRRQMKLGNEFSGAQPEDVITLMRADGVLKKSIQNALDANQLIHDIMGKWAFQPFDFDQLDKWTKRYVVQVDKMNNEWLARYEETLNSPRDIFAEHTIFVVQAAKEAYILLKKLTVLREKILAEAQISSLKDVLDYLHAATSELSEFNQILREMPRKLLSERHPAKTESTEQLNADIKAMLEV